MGRVLVRVGRWVVIALLAGLLSFAIITVHRNHSLSQCVIAFPDSLECLFDGAVLNRHLDIAEPPAYKLVMVVDSLQCSYCKIGKLQRYKDLFKESIEEGKFDLIVILSPKKEEAEDLREFLLAHDFSLPFYLDQESSFLRLNPCIPSDARSHSFLLDATGHLVFVGDPLKGNKAYKRFERAISQ